MTALASLQTSSSDFTNYDEVPYESYSYDQTQPRWIATVARLMNLSPVNPDKARVLEIGCASGWNIIPLAAQFPEATYVGIDLSARQIDEGEAHIKALGLTNIQLKAMSVVDIGAEFGQFDYIICHGVLSWVPEEVRTQIFRVCKENLSPSGLALISYNCLPGWNAVRSVRDMMQFHTSQFDTPAQKVDEAMRMLRFVESGASVADPAWIEIVKRELNILGSNDESYLLHDHLERDNTAFYLNDFVAMARESGLAYVADTLFSTMYLGNLPQNMSEALAPLNDVVRQEQYIDFVSNRRFRSSILCHEKVEINRCVRKEAIFDYYLTSKGLAPDFNAAAEDWARDVDRTFANKGLTTHTRAGAMILCVLHERGLQSISIPELVSETMKRLKTSDDVPVRQALYDLGIELLMRGRLIPHWGSAHAVKTVSTKPRVWSIARYQATKRLMVTTILHNTIPVDPVARELILLLDGDHTIDEIFPIFFARLEKLGGQFTKSDGGLATQRIDKEKIAKKQMNRLLDQFSQNCLLDA